MTTASNEKIEKQLDGILESRASGEGSPVRDVYQIDAETKELVSSHPSLEVYANEKLLTFVEQSDINGIARLLDILLGRVNRDDSDSAKLFFSALESALATLPVALCREFWPYLEVRHTMIADTAQGTNSVVFLRMCRSLIARLDVDLDSEQLGRVLQLLSVVKGFGHPSRLNKRGKVSAVPEEKYRQAVEKDNEKGECSPFTASQKLQDLSKMEPKELLEFLRLLIRKLHRKFIGSVDNIESANFDLQGWLWTDFIPVTGFRLLAEEVLIALSTITAGAKDNEELQTTISKLTSNAERILEKNYRVKLARVFTSEHNWREWKDQQCPYIEYLPSEQNIVEPEGTPLALNQNSGAAAEKPDLLSNIGNERLTRLLQAPTESSTFSTKFDNQTKAAEYREKSNNSSDDNKSYKESMDFMARRCEPWSTLLEQQSSEQVNEHEDLKQAEEQALHEATQPQLKRSSSSTQTEAPHKRPRISYEEDTRYQDRQRGMQGTARPLPY